MDGVSDRDLIHIRHQLNTKSDERRISTILDESVQSAPDGIEIGTAVTRLQANRTSMDRIESSAATKEEIRCGTIVDDHVKKHKLDVAHTELQSSSPTQTFVLHNTHISARSASSQPNVLLARSESRRTGTRRKDEMDEIFGE